MRATWRARTASKGSSALSASSSRRPATRPPRLRNELLQSVFPPPREALPEVDVAPDAGTLQVPSDLLGVRDRGGPELWADARYRAGRVAADAVQPAQQRRYRPGCRPASLPSPARRPLNARPSQHPPAADRPQRGDPQVLAQHRGARLGA